MNVTCWFPQIFDNFDIFWLPHMMVTMQGSAKQCKTYSNINISFPIFLAYSLLGTWGLWLWAVDMFDICGQLSGIFPGVCDSLGRSPELCSGTWVWVQIQALKEKDFEDPETEQLTEQFSQVRDSDLGRYFTACALRKIPKSSPVGEFPVGLHCGFTAACAKADRDNMCSLRRWTPRIARKGQNTYIKII